MNSKIDWKKQLNPAQWDAVSTIDGPLLVVAGAGTGKTRVIEYRCLHMIEKGIAPEQILLLTFTRKAARQMVSRASLNDPRCRKIEAASCHCHGSETGSVYPDLPIARPSDELVG